MMARMASADIMCVGPKSVREKFTGTIRYVNLSMFIGGKLEVDFFLGGYFRAGSLPSSYFGTEHSIRGISFSSMVRTRLFGCVFHPKFRGIGSSNLSFCSHTLT